MRRVLDLVSGSAFSGHYVAVCAAVQDHVDCDVLPVVNTQDCLILFRLQDAQLGIVVIPVFHPPCLVHQLLISDSLRNGVVEYGLVVRWTGLERRESEVRVGYLVGGWSVEAV